MYTGDFTHCTTLEQFYEEIVEAHQEAHGEAYTEVHEAIAQASGGGIYKELGIMQGASLANAVLNGDFESYQAIDIDTSRVRPYLPLFGGYPVEVFETSSLDDSIVGPCNVLYIDSKHTYRHLMMELNAHSDLVEETIVLHDTNLPHMKQAVFKFLERNNQWDIGIDCDRSVGYMTLTRI